MNWISEPKKESSTQPDQPKDLISIVSKLAELELAKARYINVGVMFWTITLIGMVSGSIFIP